ncbi:MAG TPA: hypothetical protein PK024_09750 [Methanospirillum sp.]|uniref:hypothetical protein n=1 Tax=Methanospirillum sp. TaxID=45200 RepID=UPI002C10C2E2|nr:hypothetical protein [Methanospirillum sp.]HOJ97102.1 hypothetical protein [Methanospirillum sp.]
MMEWKEESRQVITHTIKNTVYDIEEAYFEEILKNLGLFLSKKYRYCDVVSPLDVMSQIAYIKDLTVQQKMYFAFWIGKNSENYAYEEYILAILNEDNKND